MAQSADPAVLFVESESAKAPSLVCAETREYWFRASFTQRKGVVSELAKSELSEQDIRTKYITPAITGAGWDVMRQLREEVYFTKGRIIRRGNLVTRGKCSKADYVLYLKPNIPLAVVEAKDNTHEVGDGMQQALRYAEALDAPFAYSSNGDAFLEHDRLSSENAPEREIALNAFPSPDDLWARYTAQKDLSNGAERVVAADYYPDPDGREPRYYQQVAINRAVEAIAKGQQRLLLVMATGTGKTKVAFQIIWRLWKAGKRKRILFLADRNILVDQTKSNDFQPFGSAMTKITDRSVDKSYEVYLALYQAVSGSEEFQNIYKSFSPEFFDLIVVDECHRGSAREDAVWHDILNYFSGATQIGMTATPKETEDVSNIQYFGVPIYLYSLKQGINDGFLAPYTVVRIDLDKDVGGWRPPQGKRDDHGQEIEDRIYNTQDFDRTIVMQKRTELVARKVTEYLKGTDRYAKTIVFCEDIDHAQRMRSALVNENADLAAENRRYVMQITGDNQEGKAELENFTDPESRFPVIATTSKLMTTGVDAQTCKLIVLDRRINSLSEFKQIVGRGTRVREDYMKYTFTIMDFRKATEHFADPEFDGPPEQVYEPAPEDSPVPESLARSDDSSDQDTLDPTAEEGAEKDGGVEFPEQPNSKRVKYVVGDVEFLVVGERVQYMGKDGKLITEALKDYTRRTVTGEYASLDEFLKAWSEADRKQAVLDELERHGVLLEALAAEVGKQYDPFDLVCHVAYDEPPLTRQERADNVRKRNYFTKYGEKARAVLNALLDKYQDAGIENLEDPTVLTVPPVREQGTPMEIIKAFGGLDAYDQAIRELEMELYRAA